MRISDWSSDVCSSDLPISSPTPISPMPIFADHWSASPMAYQGLGDRRAGFTTPPPQARAEPAYAPPPESRSFPLGVARGQVAKTYIVAEAEDGLVIVDQHAAHERLVLERMRRAMEGSGVASQ